MRDLRLRLGIILALALLPLLILSIWRSYTDYQAEKSLLLNNSDLSAQIALNEVANNFSTTDSILKHTSFLFSAEDCDAGLTKLTTAYPTLKNIIVFDNRGNMVCSAGSVVTNQSQTDVLLEQVSPKSPFSTSIISQANSGSNIENTILTAYGAYENTILTNVFIATEDMSYFLSRFQNSKELNESDIVLLNREGVVAGGSLDISDIGELRKNIALAQSKGKQATADKHGHQILILPTPRENVFLGVKSLEPPMEPLSKFNPVFSAMTPIFAWAFGFAAIWLSTDQLILMHIRRMSRATKAFAKGDRSVRVGDLKTPPHSIAMLAKNFDIMADRIVEREAVITDSLDEKETLLREIHHRVKNNLQIIISLLNMQERKMTDKEGLSAIIETRNRINAIALVHRGLYESPDLRFVHMQTFLDRLLSELNVALGFEALDIHISTIANCQPMEADTATPVALFIVEAVTNAAKHGVRKGGNIDVLIQQTDKDVVVSISNNVYPQKNVAKTKSGGLGVKLIKGFTRQLNGKLQETKSETNYEIKLSFTPRNL